MLVADASGGSLEGLGLMADNGVEVTAAELIGLLGLDEKNEAMLFKMLKPNN